MPRRGAGRCESFRGTVDGKFLLHLADWAPLLRRLHVTCRYDMPDESFMSEVAKKLPLLRQLVLSGGLLERDSLAALVDRWPRLRLLHARVCHTTRPIGKTLRRRLEKRIKHLRLPHRHSWYHLWQWQWEGLPRIGGISATRGGPRIEARSATPSCPLK